jgi:hypothetical protein
VLPKEDDLKSVAVALYHGLNARLGHLRPLETALVNIGVGTILEESFSPEATPVVDVLWMFEPSELPSVETLTPGLMANHIPGEYVLKNKTFERLPVFLTES